MRRLWNTIKHNFLKNSFGQPLSHEAFDAYFNRLPENIQVSWFRDGKFIVGNVVAAENKFVTQGQDADDFVEMVNDAIITVYDIPKQYYDIISRAHTYLPRQEEMAKLRNTGVQSSVISIEKNEEVMQLA